MEYALATTLLYEHMQSRLAEVEAQFFRASTAQTSRRMPASRLRKLRALFRVRAVDLWLRSMGHVLVHSLQHTSLSNKSKPHWIVRQTLLALHHNVGPDMTAAVDSALTPAQQHIEEARNWRTSFGARPARVFGNNQFAPALELPCYAHHLLAICWIMGHFLSSRPTHEPQPESASFAHRYKCFPSHTRPQAPSPPSPYASAIYKTCCMGF